MNQKSKYVSSMWIYLSFLLKKSILLSKGSSFPDEVEENEVMSQNKWEIIVKYLKLKNIK